MAAAAAHDSAELGPVELKTLAGFHATWPLRLFPDALKPYGELMRLHRPAGIMMFYFPCLYGAFLVGALGYKIPPEQMALVNAKLLFLSFWMRSALCTWNDVLDQDIDRQVARTRVRPLARRAISTTAGLVWTAVQLGAVIATFVYLLGVDCLVASSPFLAMHVAYPFMKRLTHHPQLILGLAYPMGVYVAFPAFGLPIPIPSLAKLQNPYSLGAREISDVVAAVCLSAAIFLWTVLNDTIYAAQDTEDDRKAGVGSPMVYWGKSARNFLRVLGFFQVASLVAVSFTMTQSAPWKGAVYTALTCGGTLLSLSAMVEGVDLLDPASCGWWFNKGNVLVGYAIGSGLVGEYLAGVGMTRKGVSW